MLFCICCSFIMLYCIYCAWIYAYISLNFLLFSPWFGWDLFPLLVKAFFWVRLVVFLRWDVKFWSIDELPYIWAAIFLLLLPPSEFGRIAKDWGPIPSTPLLNGSELLTLRELLVFPVLILLPCDLEPEPGIPGILFAEPPFLPLCV